MANFVERFLGGSNPLRIPLLNTVLYFNPCIRLYENRSRALTWVMDFTLLIVSDSKFIYRRKQLLVGNLEMENSRK